MVKKKQKQHRKGKKHITYQKGKEEGYTEKISKMQSDLKTFINNFQSDVNKKKKAYQLYTKNFLKKKIS